MNLLPPEVIPSVLCYTLCNSHEGEELLERHKRAEIAICNANGYLLEFSKKKIINSCYILIEDAAYLQLFCQFNEEGCSVYYLIRNEDGVMIIVKKWNNILVAVGCCKNIRDLQVFDFKNTGCPQLGVYYFDSEDVHIMNFSEFDNYDIGIGNCFAEDENALNHMQCTSVFPTQEDELANLKEPVMESDEETLLSNGNESIVDFLLKKLQVMEQYNNELNCEIHKMNGILRNVHKNKYQISDKSSSMNDKQIHIKFRKIWSRIHLGYWILGIEFWNSGIRDLNRVRIVAAARDFTNYTHRFFAASDKLESNVEEEAFDEEEDKGNIAEDDPKTFKHCEFWKSGPAGNGKKEKNRSCDLRSYRKSIAVAEDLMACLAVRTETTLTVKMRYNLGISPEDILTERLGFKKAKILGANYFIKENGDLCGTSVAVQRMPNDRLSWKLRISLTNAHTLAIFVRVIYNELPMPARISILND